MPSRPQPADGTTHAARPGGRSRSRTLTAPHTDPPVTTVSRVPDGRDTRVDAYIKALPGWQQEVCNIARDLVHRTDTDVHETVKRTVQPYFVLDGNVCALLATKDHVNVFIYDPTVPDPSGLINQATGTARRRRCRSTKGTPLTATR